MVIVNQQTKQKNISLFTTHPVYKHGRTYTCTTETTIVGRVFLLIIEFLRLRMMQASNPAPCTQRLKNTFNTDNDTYIYHPALFLQSYKHTALLHAVPWRKIVIYRSLERYFLNYRQYYNTIIICYWITLLILKNYCKVALN